MYIQSYQIHNVLNVYRKQLSQGPVARSQKETQAPPQGDRVEISNNNNVQRQSIIDQVASDIVDRIAQSGPQKRFDDVLSEQLNRAPDSTTTRPLRKDANFTYTAIDENDQKVTNSLPVERFSPLMGGVTQNAQKLAD